jgi:hypothetical protein
MTKQLLILTVLSILAIPSVGLGNDFAYATYAEVLRQTVKPHAVIDGIEVNAVDYAALAEDAAVPGSPYSLLLQELAAFDPATLGSREEKMAFWINVYNIAAIKTIVDHYPVESIRSRRINWLGLPWSRKAIVVGGKEYALGQIENDLLLEKFKDLRIHFGINCASVSCVDLLPDPYRAATLYQQLEQQGKIFLSNRAKGLRLDSEKKEIYLSQVFKFDKKHFDTYAGGALKFILPYVTAAERDILSKDTRKLDYLDYDWQANDAKSASR